MRRLPPLPLFLIAALVAGLVPALASAASSAASVATASAATTAPPPRSGPKYKVLVITPADASKADRTGVQRLRQIGLDRGFTIEATTDPSLVNPVDLPRFRAVAFLNTKGNLLTDAQQDAFETYFHAGGGFLGLGSAIETEPDWPFLTELLGTRATSRTAVQTGTVKVADRGARRDQEPAGVLDPHRRLVQLRRQRPRSEPRAGHGRREALHPAALRRHAERDRRHHGRRPPGRLVQGLPGRPVVLHLRQHLRDRHRDGLRRPRRRGSWSGRPVSRTASTATAARRSWPTSSRPRSARPRT